MVMICVAPEKVNQMACENLNHKERDHRNTMIILIYIVDI